MILHFTTSEDRTLHVSVLAAIEVRSAIRRRQFDGDTDADAADVALTILMQETGRIIEHPLTSPVISEATGIIDRHRLRALDALQLASAIICKSSLGPGDLLDFVASDVRLMKAATAEGLAVWNPVSTVEKNVLSKGLN